MSDTRPELPIRQSAKLYEMRDAARRLLGDDYLPTMKQTAETIRAVAKETGTTELAAAISMSRQPSAGGFAVVMILAAFVEMTEPSHA